MLKAFNKRENNQNYFVTFPQSYLHFYLRVTKEKEILEHFFPVSSYFDTGAPNALSSLQLAYKLLYFFINFIILWWIIIESLFSLAIFSTYIIEHILMFHAKNYVWWENRLFW